ncbi:hypothetical protein [Natrinema sp. CGMCC1.2065]|uniref:hypothetical protein n=1 Tax=Natrinema sp. CGMCC1.2065 TaxID=3445767 RepID=UPI003F4A7AAE
MSNLPTRRGFLALSGTGAATGLAGCSALESLTQDDSGSADGPLTVTVTPDQEQLRSLQQELRQSIENGNISEQEAGQRYQEKQRELTEEAATAVEDLADANGDVSIEEASPAYGFFLVDAPAETIVAALQNGDISAIYPGDSYEQFAMQQAQIEQQQGAIDEQGDGTGNESTGDTNESTDGNGSTNESETDGYSSS